MAARAAVQPDCCQRVALPSPPSLPHRGQVGQELPPLGHLRHRFPLLEQARPSGRPGRTCRSRCSVSDSPQGCSRSVITRHSMPRPITSQVCAPSISSHTRTQRVAQDAAVVVHHEALVRGVHGEPRVQIREVHVSHARASAPGSAGRSGRWTRTPSRRGCARRRAVPGSSGGSSPGARSSIVTSMPSSTRVTQAGSSLRRPLDLHQAQAARADVGQPFEMAQRRDVDPVFARHFQDGLVLARADLTPSMLQCFDANSGCHGSHLLGGFDLAGAGRAAACRRCAPRTHRGSSAAC